MHSALRFYYVQSGQESSPVGQLCCNSKKIVLLLYRYIKQVTPFIIEVLEKEGQIGIT